jgi:tRNA nucleotidyltransferase (CCA-adding enzyme)
VNFIIERLGEKGFSAYAVGGAVRDMLLGRAVGDYDVTTSARPEEIIECFPDCKIIKTGIKHGTVTVIVGGESYEITTYRIDGEYTDNRHPESVIFTDKLSFDLSRRDFTVNAMCYSESEGIVDLFGGKEDLKRGIIRAVGEAGKRFEEDALRILRAIRFASVLDFEVEEKTKLASLEKRELLCGISKERIYSELKRLMAGVGAYRVINEFKEIITVVLPELRDISLPPKERFDTADWESRFFSLFASLDNPRDAYLQSVKLLKTDKNIKEKGALALENYKNEYSTEREIRYLLMKVGEEGARATLALRYTLGLSEDDGEGAISDIISRGLPYKISHLAIGGKEVMGAGIFGERIGLTLEALLRDVIDGKIDNDREALVNYLKDK